MPPSLSTIFDQVANLLIHSLGFSKHGAERQITELEKIIMAAIIKRMAEEKGALPTSLKSEKQLEHFFASFTDEKKLKKIIEEESTRILQDYFKTITAGLGGRERNHFYSSLKMIVGAT